MNNQQKNLDTLIELINTSSMTAKQKQYTNSLLGNVVSYTALIEGEIVKLRTKRHGFEKDKQFINYTDRLVGLCDILGIHEIEINTFDEEMYQFILKNRAGLKRPIHFANIQLLIQCLSIYRIFNKKQLPETLQELHQWLKENEYSEKLVEWDGFIKQQIQKENASI
jgi:hypothetical protein